jgi:CRP-like cAMP-binding protein
VNESFGDLALLAGLDRTLLRTLKERAIACRYGKDEVIVREGEMALGMYIILTGRVQVTTSRQGSAVRLTELGPKQFFAETSLIDDQPRPATITTLEQTECLLITRASVTELINSNPRIAIQLARSLAERQRRASDLGQVVSDSPYGIASRSRSNSSAEALSGASVKAAVQERLLNTFERLYMVKAFTRFSVAVLGCPVEGAASNLIDEIRVGDVKALILPAGEPVEVRIEAFGAGSFSLHVFTPQLAAPVRFGPVPIQPRDRFTLRLPVLELAKSGPRGAERVPADPPAVEETRDLLHRAPVR